jgi:phage gp36-like protein
MTYCTEAQLDTEFGPEAVTLLADRDGDGVRDVGVVARALDWADNLINSKISGAIEPFPLAAPYPPRLVDIAVDLACYRLFRVPTEEAADRYKGAVRQLDAIRDGKESLGLDGVGAAAVGESDTVAFAAPDRIFDDSAMAGY